MAGLRPASKTSSFPTGGLDYARGMLNPRRRWPSVLGGGALLYAAVLVVAGTGAVAPVTFGAAGRALVATAVAAEPAGEADPPRAQNLYRTVMSPFCPGRTLDDCPSPYAGEWRRDIRKWVQEGVSSEEIRKRLLARAPDKDLTGTPSTAWDAVLPISVTLGALLLLGILLRLLLRPATPRPVGATTSPGKLDEKQLEQRLNDELQALDE